MARIVNLGLLSLVIISLVGTAEAFPKEVTDPATTVLRDNWFIQPSADVHADGEAISSVGFSTRDWYPATLPSTVMSALVEDKVYPDPYTGMNLRSIPGTTYPIFEDFSNIPMPPASPFRQSWWYRTEFKLPPEYSGKTVWLGFDGINYRANVWMNGVQIASSENLAGTWRLFNLDVTSAAKPGQTNSLAVEIFPPQPRDLAITLVDWAPMPPDKEMGIWRDVHITATGPIALRYPAVLTKLNLPSADKAMLTVRAELTNAADHPVDVVCEGTHRKPRLRAASAPRPERDSSGPLHAGDISAADNRQSSPVVAGPGRKAGSLPARPGGRGAGTGLRFSSHSLRIRQVTSNIDEKGHRIFQINGKNILIRGAGYSFDCCCAPRRRGSRPNSTTCAISTSTRCGWKANWRTITSSTSPTRWEFS